MNLPCQNRSHAYFTESESRIVKNRNRRAECESESLESKQYPTLAIFHYNVIT